MYQINPAFDRFPKEAALIGKILASFGEIEFSVCRNAAHATDLEEQTLKALYRLRMTSGRLDAADALTRPVFDWHKLGNEYRIAYKGVRHCLGIRNEYAHCNWGDNASAGLFFADLQAAAETETGWEPIFFHVDAPLLQAQLDFFAYVMEWLHFLDHELAVKQERLKSHVWPKPPAQGQPPLHNPPAEHVPPWLNADQQALHLARAQAAQGGPPTPTPAQQALDRARAEKRARQEADRQRDQKGHSGGE